MARALIAQGGGAGDQPMDPLREGDVVQIDLLRRLDEHHYEGMLDGRLRIVESTTPLPVGVRIEALVVRVADRLELRYPAAGDGSGLTDAPDEAQRLLLQRAFRHRIHVPAALLQSLAEDSKSSTDRERWIDAALFLLRSGNTPSKENVRLIYEAQSRQLGPPAPPASTAVATLDPSQLEAQLANALGGADGYDADQGGSGGADSGGREGSEQRRSQLSALLGRDPGARVTRYGQLPLLVDGRLVEVDLALFRDRQNLHVAHPLQRMVMSIQTHSLGMVKVSVDVVGQRLAIQFLCESASAAASLAEGEEHVRRLASESGWCLETVRYRIGDSVGRAARDVVEQVLREGSIHGCV